MRDNPGGESDPAKGVRRRCKKNSVLSCIGKQEKAVAVKLGQFKSSEETEGI